MSRFGDKSKRKHPLFQAFELKTGQRYDGLSV